jgi:uncharacterized protein (UPF0248 family)
MQTIIELVSDIRWNKNRDPDEYTIGYYDRVAKVLRWIRFTDIDFSKTDGFSFFTQADGKERHIPFHRVRQVKKCGELIWERYVEAPAPSVQ